MTAIDDMVMEGKSMITVFIIGHGFGNMVRLNGEKFRAPDFSSKFESHPGVLFNFIIGSCYSGYFVSELKSVPNVRVVMSACGLHESAWPDWDIKNLLLDYNMQDSGSEWTSSVLEAAKRITTDEGRWSLVVTRADTYGIPRTCQLLFEAYRGALGQNERMKLTDNLDLSNRLDVSHPDGYFSWLERVGD